MLIFILFSLISSLTIPHSQIYKPKIHTIHNEEEIIKLSENQIVVCLKTSVYNSQFLQPFMEAQSLFDQIYPFVVKFEETMPTIEIYNNSVKIASFSPIIDEASLLQCLDVVLTENPTIYQTSESLFSSFGETSLTLIGTLEDKELMINLSLATPNEKGVCSLSFTTKEVLNELGFNTNELGVYHTIDNNIKTFNKEHENVLENYLIATKPEFDYMTFKELKEHQNGKLLFTILRDKINTNHSDYLFDMTQKYKENVDFAVMKKDGMAFINEFTHVYSPYAYNAKVVVLNISGGYFYNIEEYLTEEMKVNYFDKKVWEPKTIWFLDSILNNTLPKTYRSEYEPRNSLMQSVTKVVSLTYDKFFESINETDILMYYVVDNQVCRRLFDQYVTLGKILIEKMGYKGCKLGFIDISANMIEGGFPVKQEETPSIILHTAKENKLIKMDKEITVKSMAEFIHENGTGTFNLTQFIDLLEPKEENQQPENNNNQSTEL